MTSVADRRVHATLAGVAEIVRYERAGKWYFEPVHGRRLNLTVQDAAEVAAEERYEVTFGLPGGSRFDAEYKRLQQEAAT